MNANSFTTEDSKIVIREIDGQKELRAVEGLQKVAWGVPDLEVVPYTQLLAAVAAGGVLLGAFDDRTLAGFVYGFVGYERDRTTHHSHMLAVLPEYRDRDLGRLLKLAQREHAVKQGIELMTWTFDPLQSLNAHFNFRKLSVYCDRYFVNFYGAEAVSFLHQTGTDRLWVTWDLAKAENEKHVDEKVWEIAPLVRLESGENPIAGDLDAGLRNENALIEIPTNINEIVNGNKESATTWRELTRRAFTAAIDAGFLVKDFRRIDRGDHHAGVYLLTNANSKTRT